MEELLAYRADLLAALGAVVDNLAKAVDRLPSDDWHTPTDPGAIDRHYLLAQMYARELEVFSGQLTRILAEKDPLFPAYDDTPWMAEHYDPDEPAVNIIEEIRNSRHKELEWLQNLPPEAWSRTARHPWWGSHTLQWWVELQLEYSRQVLKRITTSGEM